MVNMPTYRSFQDADVPYVLPNDAPEWARLDAQYNGIREFLNGRLSLAPIEKNAVNDILEIGSGSGAWVIEAARRYPGATVTAVDVSPLPPRPLPPNVRFCRVDVTKELPFEHGSFDVVHARFTFVHLAHWEDVCRRVVPLLRPGGWFLVEDLDHDYLDARGERGPWLTKWFNFYNDFALRLGVDSRKTGSKVKGVLKATGSFLDVNTFEVDFPFNGKHQDPKIGALGRVMSTALCTAYRDMGPRLVSAGFTQEMYEGIVKEMNDPDNTIYSKMTMTWAQKKWGCEKL